MTTTPQQAPGPILSDARIAEIADATGMMAKGDVLDGSDGGRICIDFASAIAAEVAAVPGKKHSVELRDTLVQLATTQHQLIAANATLTAIYAGVNPEYGPVAVPGKEPVALPHKMGHPTPSDLVSVAYANGWNDCRDTMRGSIPDDPTNSPVAAPVGEVVATDLPLPWKSIVQAIAAVDAEASERGKMYPQNYDEQREDRAAAKRTIEQIEWYATRGGSVAEKLPDWPRAALPPQAPAPPNLIQSLHDGLSEIIGCTKDVNVLHVARALQEEIDVASLTAAPATTTGEAQ